MSNIDNNSLLKYICELIIIEKNKKDYKEGKIYYLKKQCYTINDNNSNLFSGSHYLLGQIIRQFRPVEDHLFISKKVLDKFEELGQIENVWNYEYQNLIENKSSNEVNIIPYSGNHKKNSETFKPKEKRPFNNIFVDEHMIDIKTIIDKLSQLDEVNEKNVFNYLKDHIYIARILKEEDKTIEKKFNRLKEYEKKTEEKKQKESEIEFIKNNIYIDIDLISYKDSLKEIEKRK